MCFQKSGREEQALDAFDEVLHIDEDHWRTRFHLALLCISNGEYHDAEILLEHVLELQPEHADAGAILAKLHERRDAEEGRLEVPEDVK